MAFSLPSLISPNLQLPISVTVVMPFRKYPPPLLRSNTLSSSSSRNCSMLIKCFSRRQFTEEVKFERLFSNLNQTTLKRDPGSLSSAILLVAGTTVGAGILAIPAVTQESGFLASAITCIACWIYMVTTGLLIAEVNVKTMCELGSGGVSLVSMAMRTLGTTGVQIACWSYIFIHYAVLVAYVARSSEILTNFLGIPLWESAMLFSMLFGGICYFGSQRLIGAVNGVLVFGIVVSFAALVDRRAGRMIGGGYESHDLYRLSSPASACSLSTDPLTIHAQSGHPSLANLQQMVPSLSKLPSLHCESCQLGKHTRSSFPTSTSSRASSPFLLVHSDIWGPSRSAFTLVLSIL